MSGLPADFEQIARAIAASGVDPEWDERFNDCPRCGGYGWFFQSGDDVDVNYRTPCEHRESV